MRPIEEFNIELSEEEILEDLLWPLPPPGRWQIPQPVTRLTAHVDDLLEEIESSARAA